MNLKYDSIENTKLPDDTRKNLNYSDIENFSLKLNKAAIYDEKASKFVFFQTEKGKIIFEVKVDFSKIDIQNIARRIKASIEKLGLTIKSTKLTPDWRLVVGLGNESVYETSITLHHIYGFPYIPASAVKGISRDFFISSLYEKTAIDDINQMNIIEKILTDFDMERDNKIEYDRFSKKFAVKKIAPERVLYDYFNDNKVEIAIFQKIFGTQKNSGNVIFFDAFPLEDPKIEPDIMNPHYAPYYSDNKEKTPPADYHSPIPIHFLTVVNTPFQFIIGIKPENNTIVSNIESQDKNLLDIAYENMQKALAMHGVGAKTAVGYGYFNMPDKKKSDETALSKEKPKSEKDILTQKLNDAVNGKQIDNYYFDKIIDYYKQHAQDTQYGNLILNTFFDFKTVELLKKSNSDVGIANKSFELYKFVAEHNDSIKADLASLENKVGKIVKKLGGEKLKKKWEKYQ